MTMYKGAAIYKMQGGVPGGSRLVTVTQFQGRVVGGGWLVVNSQQSDCLKIEAGFQSLGPRLVAPVLSPPLGHGSVG